MIGLIIKDMYSMKSLRQSFLFIIVLYSFIGVMGKNTSVVTGMIIVVMSMMTLTTFSYDDASKWDKYALSLPITRKDLVLSKYISAFLFTLLGSVVSVLLNIVIVAIKHNFRLSESFIVVYSVSMVAILLLSLVIPIVFKFGVEKARLAMFVAVLIPTGLVYLCAQMGLGVPSDDMFMRMLGFSPVVVAGGVAVSYYISLRVYSKKDM